MPRSCFKFFVGVAALVLFSTACIADDKKSAHAPEWVGLLDQATNVEAVLLTDGPQGIKERTKHHAIDQQTTERIKKLFQSDSNWPDYLDMCDPIYGAQLIFFLKPTPAGETNNVAVSICFHCNDVAATYNGKWLGSRKFSGNQALLKIFHDSFPGDTELPAAN